MPDRFEIDEARALMPRVHAVADRVIPLRAELVARMQRNRGEGGLAEIKALEAELSELLDGLTSEGIQLKGYAPLLVDFPHHRGGRDLLLCWLEGEPELAWYHDAAHGFMGRRPLSGLD